MQTGIESGFSLYKWVDDAGEVDEVGFGDLVRGISEA